MAKPFAGVPRMVWGPTPKKGRFQVVVETTDKKRHARTFSKRAEAVTFAEETRSRIARPQPVADDSQRGTSVWWRGVLSRAAAQIEAAPADPLQSGRVLASLGVAAAKHASDAETEGPRGKRPETPGDAQARTQGRAATSADDKAARSGNPGQKVMHGPQQGRQARST